MIPSSSIRLQYYWAQTNRWIGWWPVFKTSLSSLLSISIMLRHDFIIFLFSFYLKPINPTVNFVQEFFYEIYMLKLVVVGKVFALNLFAKMIISIFWVSFSVVSIAEFSNDSIDCQNQLTYICLLACLCLVKVLAELICLKRKQLYKFY